MPVGIQSRRNKAFVPCRRHHCFVVYVYSVYFRFHVPTSGSSSMWNKRVLLLMNLSRDWPEFEWARVEARSSIWTGAGDGIICVNLSYCCECDRELGWDGRFSDDSVILRQSVKFGGTIVMIESLLEPWAGHRSSWGDELTVMTWPVDLREGDESGTEWHMDDLINFGKDEQTTIVGEWVWSQNERKRWIDDSIIVGEWDKSQKKRKIRLDAIIVGEWD